MQTRRVLRNFIAPWLHVVLMLTIQMIVYQEGVYLLVVVLFLLLYYHQRHQR